ncbi:MMPL family transporter [Dactylosporangium sp. NBC_01737]|uniref:MMPL family transporter n=1 Tax=Dactylosporangium sp. NBC_01737 TaxID=2975959 RepID=UPI002E10E031|nr:MMPL family transporter [Dactylosporangium sp. NBC_01737]
MFRMLTALALRRPVMVIVFWVAVVAVGFGVGGGVFMKLTAQVATVPGSETERALDLRDQAAGPRPAQLTVVATGGVDLSAALTEVRVMAGVTEVGTPLPSADGKAVLLQVTVAPSGTEAAAKVADRLRAVDPARVTVTGGPLTDSEFSAQAQSDVQRAELFTLPVVLILLVVVFGGILAGAMPLLVALAGIGGTFGLLYALSFGTDISVYAIQVATMLSVGLAVDYGLLLISRFRNERAATDDVATALAAAVDKAGRTIAVTGLTVAASLLGLAVFPDAFLRSMGLAGTGVVLVNMLAVLTLLPAVLALVGRRVRPAAERAGGGVFGRIAVAVQRRPVLTTVLTAAGLLALAVPAVHMRLGNSDARALPSSTQTRQQYDQLAAHYPALVGPDDILAVVRSPATDPSTVQFADRVRGVPGVSAVQVEPVSPSISLVRATPVHRPETPQGRATVTAVRSVAAPFEVLVTGDAARLVDYRGMLADYGPLAALIVVAATVLLLAAFTRSLLLPLKAVLTSILSIGAALGVVTLVFQDRGDLGMIDLTVPVLVAAIAFGLSVDYEVFLLARIREHRLTGADSRRSVAVGLQQTGRIVTSAALLLVVVFAGFLLGGFAPIREIGLGLVVAIVLDATVVRMLLVPATMTLLGRAAWWPGRVPPAKSPAGVGRYEDALV